MVLPGRWWLQNLILKHIYKKDFPFFRLFRPRLPSKFVKSADDQTNFFPKIAIGVSKNAEFNNLMLISNPLKSYKKLKFCVLWYTQIEFLKRVFWLINRTKQLIKTKNLIYKGVLESHFTPISGLGGSILSQKKSKSFYPILYMYSVQYLHMFIYSKHKAKI